MKVTPFGFRFAGNARMQRGEFEQHETRLLQRLAPEIDVFVDVGANIGYYVCLMRSLGKQVVAVEPLRQNLDYLIMNVLENGWADVELLPVGLADRTGLVEMYGGGTGASLIPQWSGASTNLHRTIPVSTLDDVVGTRFGGRRVLVKVDVEGAELGVLRGAQRTLRATPAPRWLIEVCLTEHHPSGRNPSYLLVFDEFFGQDYRAYSVESGMRPVTKADVQRWFDSGQRDFGSINFLFEKRPE
jgi:FkbM family methyltransferase